MVKGKVIGVRVNEDEGGVWSEVTIAFRRRGLPSTINSNYNPVVIDGAVVPYEEWIANFKADKFNRFNAYPTDEDIADAKRNYDHIVKRFNERLINQNHNEALDKLSLGYVNMEYVNKEAFLYE